MMAAWLATEHIDAIVTSPMVRARQTAEPLEAALGLQARIEPRVAEYDRESSSYIPMEELRSDKEAWRAWLTELASDDMSSFANETIAGMQDIVANHRGQRVAVVCHGGVINMWAAHVLGLGHAMFFAPDYTSINRFMASSGGTNSVVSLNDVGHLRPHADLQLS